MGGNDFRPTSSATVLTAKNSSGHLLLGLGRSLASASSPQVACPYYVGLESNAPRAKPIFKAFDGIIDVCAAEGAFPDRCDAPAESQQLF